MGFIIIVLWGILSVAVGFIAYARGRDPFFFGILSLVLSPAIVYLILLALPVVPAPDCNQAYCPHCRGVIDKNVVCCKYCGRDVVWAQPVDPAVEVPKPSPPPPTPPEPVVKEDEAKVFMKQFVLAQVDVRCPECRTTFKTSKASPGTELICPKCQSVLEC